MTGEVIPLDLMATSKGRVGVTRRFPIGPIAAISPFNFPLNLAAHKVAPAIAAGCSIVLKPPSKDPLVMLRIARYLDETDLPPGAVSILPMDRPTGDAMVSDDRFKLLSFTGSPSVGWKMKASAGQKKVVLELGGNAGAIVDEWADLDWAVKRLVFGSFAYAGQICISVQRIYVVDAIYDEFERRFVEAVRAVKVGDPLDPSTDLGPMVDERAVSRTDEWVREALDDGARDNARRLVKRQSPHVVRIGLEQHLVEDDAERVDVRGRPHRRGVRLDLLRAHVLGRADRDAGPGEGGAGGMRGGFRNPEVGYHHPPASALEQDVVRLDVAVNDPGLVRGVERGRRLQRDV